MYTQKEICPLRDDVNKKFTSIKILKKSHLTLPSHSYKNEDSPRFSRPLRREKHRHTKASTLAPIRSRVDGELGEFCSYCPTACANLVFNAYRARISRAADSNGKKVKVPALWLSLWGMVWKIVLPHCEKAPWRCMPLNKTHWQADQSLQLGAGTMQGLCYFSCNEEMLHWEQRQREAEWEGYS